MAKNILTHRTVIIIFLTIVIISCKKDLQPYNGESDKMALNTAEDLQMATYGTYAGLVNRGYTKNQNQLGAYSGDNITLSGTTGDQVFFTYTYTQYPNQGNTTQFWGAAYKVIYSANAIIEKIEDATSPKLDQIKGENLYLRAMAHFDLVRIFARPYLQGNGNNPGIPIEKSTVSDLPSRSSVKEVYDFITNDLKNAANLMTIEKNACYASKEVAYALLSRIYLYKESNDSAIYYTDKVIQSGRYQLMATEPYKKYFTIVPDDNPETIFAIKHTPADDRGKDAIGSMYYNDPVTLSSGWGEVYASVDFVNLLDKYPEDVRHSFIEPQRDNNGNMLARHNVPKYYINKYNWQGGIVDLSSPVYLRLAEMYLNRAEANAKLGNNQLAIDDINLIRERAGLSGNALYTVNDLKGHSNVLEVVLEERRIELAFEAQRAFDLFRNNLPLIRNYPGFHGTDNMHQTILPTDPRVASYIPEREIQVNPNLTQNP